MCVFPRRILRGALAALFLAAALPAQVTVPSPEEDEEDVAVADLRLFLDLSGTASIDLTLILPAETRGDAREALAQSLGCRLEYKDLPIRSLTSGQCAGFARRHGAAFGASLDLIPLIEYLKPLRVRMLYVSINLPRAGYRVSSPAAVPLPEEFEYETDVLHFAIPVDSPPAPTIRIEYGYCRADLLRAGLPLAVIFVLPIGLVLWMRGVALRAPADQRIPAWHGYWRFFERTMLGTWFVWWSAVDALQVSELSLFLLGGTSFLNTIGFRAIHPFLLVLLPPGVINLICSILSYPVQARVRGTDWTRQEIFRQTVWGQVAGVLPIVLVGGGVIALAKGHSGAGVLWLAGAFAARMVAMKKLAQALDLTPHALTTGELRDRIFALADKAGVKLQQIFLLPAGKGRLANAFAMQGNIVLLTDYLLRKLNKREVDAVMAHELAHLKGKHIGKALTVYLLGLGAAVVFYPFISALFGMPRWVPVMPLLVMLALFVHLLFSRRREREADAGAYKLTGDAEGLITGLVKVNRLSLLPIKWGKWDERLSTHPSTVRRAQALARLAGIPSGRLEALLAAPDTPEEHYASPPALAGGGKVFSTTVKGRINLRFFCTLLAGTTIPPAVIAWVVRFAGWEGATRWTIYAAGLGATIAIYLWLANVSPLRGYDDLERRLRTKLDREGIKVREWRGCFVGLSPDASPRSYEGHSVWDVGFLFWSEDRLCYAGEEARFALRREQISGLRLGPGPAGWWRTERVYVSWGDAQRATSGTFHLTPLAAGSIRQLRRRVQELARELQDWRERAAARPALSPALTELATPAIGEVTSLALSAVFAPGKIAKSLVLLAFIAFGFALVFGLSFGTQEILLWLFRAYAADSASVPVDASGWYVVGVALLASIFQMFPQLRRRDPAR